MYTEINFKTKKAFKEAFKSGQKIKVYQPGGIFVGKTNGMVTIEAPHFPEPHRWYAAVEIEDSIVTRIIS